VRVDLSQLKSGKLRAWWFDPRTGVGTLIGILDRNQNEFRTPPYGPDWILAIETAEANYPPPGLDAWAG